MSATARNCPHCGAVLPLPDDLSVLKLTCPFCQREYLASDVVGSELLAAQHVERSLSSHAAGQRRLVLGLGVAVLAAIVIAVLVLRGSASPEPPPVVSKVPAAVVEPATPPAVEPTPAPSASAEVVASNVLLLFGGEGTGPGQFDRAHNLAVDRQGNVYVVDRTNRVQRFDAEGKLTLSFLAETKRKPRGPLSSDVSYIIGIAADRAGKMYVALGYDIQVFSATGKLERTIAGSANTCYRELSLDQSENLYARAHCSDEHVNSIVKLSKQGALLKRFEEPRTYEQAATGGVGVDAAGNLYVPHGYEYEVQIFSPKGELRDRFGRHGRAPGEFDSSFMSSLAFDSKGRLFLRCASVVSYFETNGRYLGDVPTKAVGHPLDIAVGPDDSLWLLAGNGKVGKLRAP